MDTTHTPRLTFILGGARSGKSAYAEQLAREEGKHVLYVATAEAGDAEIATRIAAHRDERPANWQTVEDPTGVGCAIRSGLRQHPQTDVILVDCITLLASNLIVGLPEPIEEKAAEAVVQRELNDLLTIYGESELHWIMVSNEVGLGLVPPYPLGRIYRDVLGRANQRLAAAADVVYFMVAGLPMQVK